MRHVSGLSLSVILALFGACVADDGTVQNAVDSHTSTLQQGPTASWVGNEAKALYQELAARLDERGVTPEEMQAAVEDGDADGVRELFGMTPEELDVANARVLELAAAVRHAAGDTGTAGPEGLRCRVMMSCAFSVMSLAAVFPGFAAGILVVGGLACAWESCEWDDGPGTKQP
jgi:hypothetical protein